MKSGISYRLFRFGCLVLFLSSMYPWVAWHFFIFPSMLGFLVSIPFLSSSFHLICSKYKFYLFSLVALVIWISIRASLFAFVLNFLSIIPLFVLVGMSVEEKQDVLDFILKWFAILLGVSICVYIPVKLGVPFPNSIISFDDVVGYDEFTNYYVLITKPFSFRFQSVFLEPGHMTMGIAPLLYIYRYNLRNKYVAILLVAQLLSLSLAGYVTMVVGYVFQSTIDRQQSRSFKSFLLILIAVYAIGKYLPAIVGVDDLFDQALFARVDDYSSNGIRRTSAEFDNVYNRVISSSDKWLGISMNTDDYGGSGYKKFIVSYGIFGILISLLVYFYSFFKNKSKSAFFFFIILVILLYQNSYPIWFCILSSSLLGSSSLNNSKYA